jgi:hypothetical protein
MIINLAQYDGCRWVRSFFVDWNSRNTASAPIVTAKIRMYIGLRLRLFIIIKLKESLGIYEGLYGKIHYALENIPERTSEEQIYVFKGRKKKKE